MFARLTITVALTAALGALPACKNDPQPTPSAPAAPAAAPAAAPHDATLTDDAGQAIDVSHAYQRIAAGASFAGEYLAALDHPPVLRPAAPADYPISATLQQVPEFGIDHAVGPNIEQLTAAQPDLVILSPMFARFAPTITKASGAPVAVFNITSIDQVPGKAQTFGKLIGDEPAGKALAEKLQTEIDAVRGPADAPAPKVFAIFGTPQAFFAFLPDSYIGSMVQHLGGQLITADSAPSAFSSQLTPFSIEALVMADPDVILLIHHGPAGPVSDKLTTNPAWAGLTAVKTGRVHRISAQLYMTHPGPSAVTALQQLKPLLYPAPGSITAVPD